MEVDLDLERETELSTLPVDIWANLSEFLDYVDVFLLYATGDSHLIGAIRAPGVVRTLDIEIEDFSENKKNWPSFVSIFPTLESLILKEPMPGNGVLLEDYYDDGNIQQKEMINLKLLDLSPFLKSLKLLFIQAAPAFKQYIMKNGGPSRFRSHFNSLEFLSIGGLGSKKEIFASQLFLDCLPPSLTHLRATSIPISMDHTDYLPASLTFAALSMYQGDDHDREERRYGTGSLSETHSSIDEDLIDEDEENILDEAELDALLNETSTELSQSMHDERIQNWKNHLFKEKEVDSSSKMVIDDDDDDDGGDGGGGDNDDGEENDISSCGQKDDISVGVSKSASNQMCIDEPLWHGIHGTSSSSSSAAAAAAAATSAASYFPSSLHCWPLSLESLFLKFVKQPKLPNVWNYDSLAVFPIDEVLKSLPSSLKKLEFQIRPSGENCGECEWNSSSLPRSLTSIHVVVVDTISREWCKSLPPHLERLIVSLHGDVETRGLLHILPKTLKFLEIGKVSSMGMGFNWTDLFETPQKEQRRYDDDDGDGRHDDNDGIIHQLPDALVNEGDEFILELWGRIHVSSRSAERIQQLYPNLKLIASVADDDSSEEEEEEEEEEQQDDNDNEQRK
jgi:hypothetical protein